MASTDRSDKAAAAAADPAAAAAAVRSAAESAALKTAAAAAAETAAAAADFDKLSIDPHGEAAGGPQRTAPPKAAKGMENGDVYFKMEKQGSEIAPRRVPPRAAAAAPELE